MLAFDRLGAGRGDTVLVTNDGQALQEQLGRTTPGRWSVMGLPDRIDRTAVDGRRVEDPGRSRDRPHEAGVRRLVADLLETESRRPRYDGLERSGPASREPRSSPTGCSALRHAEALAAGDTRGAARAWDGRHAAGPRLLEAARDRRAIRLADRESTRRSSERRVGVRDRGRIRARGRPCGGPCSTGRVRGASWRVDSRGARWVVGARVAGRCW